MLYDMHCHLDFADDGVAIARREAGRIAAFSATVDPASAAAAQDAFGCCADVRIGWGLHPWQASSPDFPASIGEFVRQAPRHAFIGEVGLDFSAKHAATRAAQVEAFDRVVEACLVAPDASSSGEGASAGGIVSIHAVHAADEVLDTLGRFGVLDGRARSRGAYAAGRAVVIHSFNGTSDQLTRAIRSGLFFSVGPRMLASKRGRAYARAIPAHRLLLETDMPSAQGASFSFEAHVSALEGAAKDLAAARGEDEAFLLDCIAETSRSLLGTKR
ncbi:MAG: TatD family hydrolase [Slackia sp.]|nr:TatD family hydrolase [Slackia sp.]